MHLVRMVKLRLTPDSSAAFCMLQLDIDEEHVKDLSSRATRERNIALRCRSHGNWRPHAPMGGFLSVHIADETAADLESSQQLSGHHGGPRIAKITSSMSGYEPAREVMAFSMMYAADLVHARRIL